MVTFWLGSENGICFIHAFAEIAIMPIFSRSIAKFAMLSKGTLRWPRNSFLNGVLSNIRRFSQFGLQSGNRDFLLFLLSQFHQKCFRYVKINSNALIRIQCMNLNTYMVMDVNRGIKKRPKLPRFSCPLIVPICIIKSMGTKIAKTISSN